MPNPPDQEWPTPDEGQPSQLPPPFSLEPLDPAGVDFKPWEQRLAPGMSGGGRSGPPPAPADLLAERQLEETGNAIVGIVDDQVALAAYPCPTEHRPAQGNGQLNGLDNAEVWRQFQSEELYDTRRVTLEHFHLFEWFPRVPGKFHTPQAGGRRYEAYQFRQQTADGRTYFTPLGKALMVTDGGVGVVRLRPRLLPGLSGAPEAHYFMTASSNGVCHEGFPVLIPRRFYGAIKARLLDEGGVPAILHGEMRYIPDDVAVLFQASREIPRLYLVVDDLTLLPQPRSDVTRYLITVAVSFRGRFQGRPGVYLAFASFDPAEGAGLERAVAWLENYAVDLYEGAILTDFDETKPQFAHFPQATFSLAGLMQGELDPAGLTRLLEGLGYSPAEIERNAANLITINHYVTTRVGGVDIQVGDQGSVVIGGNVAGLDVTTPTPPAGENPTPDPPAGPAELPEV